MFYNSAETLLGDTAVAVNPKDERYKDIIGKMLKLPLTDREIPVIADEYVDMEFGTGCVKITPRTESFQVQPLQMYLRRLRS